ncbi:Uncharacterised protein, partial [Mycoplasma putrefaciens]
MIFAFKKITDLKAKMIATLKEDKLRVLLVVSIFTLLMFLIASVLYGIIAAKLGLGESQNQQALVEPLKDPKTRIAYIFVLIVLTIIIGPLLEELIARQAIFTTVSSRW